MTADPRVYDPYGEEDKCAKDGPGQAQQEGYLVQSLVRGLRVLVAVTNGARSFQEVAAATGLNKATARRLLLTLRDSGFLYEEGRKFFPTPAVVALAGQYLDHHVLVRNSYSELERLAHATGRSTNLAVLYGDQVLYLNRVAFGSRILEFDLHVGSTLPAHATSLGKAILAFLPEERMQQLYGNGTLERFTDNTVKSLTALQEELARIRCLGYSTSNREYRYSLVSFAAPIFNVKREVVGAINVSTDGHNSGGPELIVRELLLSSKRISYTLGYRDEN
ncbi:MULTISPECIES: IclR family transcriptional regulator [Kyrpidia]|uniref:Transcriptional regulator, IclR family n=2 Tax=Kyrpidia spormannii TaxID=2055160 RepID=A0ACA8Z6W4_9BACL|nr:MULTISPECIES: IclR family transcriptional regulator [Kyrpidia]MCL6576413.1 IclR family transcriptional regulator [Kyrpidia sp.]CAB3390654.1 Transcriptional regulator, IclR family [Kyrpidia spormannii]CAB3391570.1 Transcriptional regulator, IclR family [Kyrpidia spormannii]HHY66559.1 IclR family transcriptional regulator [Alicyclobacillus sp.]